MESIVSQCGNLKVEVEYIENMSGILKAMKEAGQATERIMQEERKSERVSEMASNSFESSSRSDNLSSKGGGASNFQQNIFSALAP